MPSFARVYHQRRLCLLRPLPAALNHDLAIQTTLRHANKAADPVRPCGLAENYSPPQITRSRPSNSVLESSQTTPWHYPESSGFGRRREREWGYGRHRRRVNQESPLMRIYIIGNDGITLCREPPTAVNEGEIVVASNEELHAARLSGKQLLALWNALPGVEKRRKVGDRDELTDQLWLAIELLPDPE